MSKRYSFWRSSTGEANRTDFDRYAPHELLKDCIANASLSSGGVSWKNGVGSEYLEAIAASVVILEGEHELDEDTSQRLARAGLSKAIAAAVSKRVLTPSSVLREVDKEVFKHCTTPHDPYIFVAGVSVRGWSPSVPRIIRGCKIAPLVDRSEFPVDSHTISVFRAGPLGEHYDNSPYQLVRVDCNGRNAYEAASHAEGSLDLLRGLWSLIWTRGSESWGTPNRPRPIGEFHRLAVSTIHLPDGTHVDGKWWYDPSYPRIFELSPAKHRVSEWQTAEDTCDAFLERLATHAFPEEVMQSICRYARSIDGIDYDAMFLNLWSLLEYITGTIGKSYDDTVSFAVWGLNDAKLIAQFLSFCRMRRNLIVHSSRSAGSSRQVYQLKDIIERHLIRLVRNDLETSSLSEYQEYLRLPKTSAVLLQRRERVARAIRYLDYEDIVDDGLGI